MIAGFGRTLETHIAMDYQRRRKFNKGDMMSESIHTFAYFHKDLQYQHTKERYC